MIDQNDVLGAADDRQSVFNSDAPPAPLVDEAKGKRKGPLLLLAVFGVAMLGIVGWIVIKLTSTGDEPAAMSTLSAAPAEPVEAADSADNGSLGDPVEHTPVVDPALMPQQAQVPMPGDAPVATPPMPTAGATPAELPSAATTQGTGAAATPMAAPEAAPAQGAAAAKAAATAGAQPQDGGAAPVPVDGAEAEIAAEIARLKRQLAAHAAEIERLKRGVGTKAVEHAPRRAKPAATSQRVAASGGTSVGPKPNASIESPPSAKTSDTGGLVLKAVLEGRAWLQLRSGETVTVAPGDQVAGVTVESIDAAKGLVRLSNGTVLR